MILQMSSRSISTAEDRFRGMSAPISELDHLGSRDANEQIVFMECIFCVVNRRACAI